MLNLKKYSHFFLLAAFVLFAASCQKRDENLKTDFESKKASAEKLVTEVNEGLAKMDADHAGMMRDLDSAGRASKDSSKVTGVREDMNRHMEQATKVKALVDSVKAYTTVNPENDDQMRAANDRLGTHFNDLENEWKTLQDQHAKLQQDIMAFSVNAAGQAVIDSADAATAAAGGKASTNGTASSGSKTGSRPAPANNTGGTPRKSSNGSTSTGTGNRPAPTNQTPGSPRKSSNGSTTTTTTTTTTTDANRPAPANNTPGTQRRSSGGTSTTK